jgi:hypothetical protein
MQSLYKPLNSAAREIRLLELHPAKNPADPIKCTIRNVFLATKPSYLALSYVWGDAKTEIKSSIYVNDIDFPATLNLCAALKRMRFDLKPCTLWVDAVCINQAEKSEKSAQVRMMRDIYEHADEVTVWLGERDSHSDKAMPLIFSAARLYERDKRAGSEVHQVMMYALEQEGTVSALAKFLQRDWWSRVWVIQEVAVSQRAVILCGDRPLSWSDFIDAFLFWIMILKEATRMNELSTTLQYLKSIMDGTSARTVVWQHARFHEPQPEKQQLIHTAYGLQEMLEESWTFDSTDPRDKIYAWIGLVKKKDVAIVPDYDAKIAQVYAGLVKTMVEQIGSLTLIAFTGSALRKATPPIDDLPSWALDLRKGAIGLAEKFPHWLRPKSFKASSNLSAVASFSDDLRTLTVSAVKVGRIELVDTDRSEGDNRYINDTFCRWLYLVLERKSNLARGTGPPHDALFRILVSFWHDLHLGLPMIDYQNQLLDMNHMRLGYMAFIGCNDRAQDYIVARHEEAERDTATYLHRTIAVPLPSGETKTIAVIGPATAALPEIIRPESMNSNPSNNKDKSVQEDKPPPKPNMDDFSNLVRFFELWKINIELKSNSCVYLRLLREFLQSANSALPTNLNDWPDGAESSLKPLLLNKILRFIGRFASVIAGKAFYVTDSGYLGLGLNAIRVSDYVCIIRGCSLPVVIREYNGGDSFEVMGQCYTWGTMYGEFVESMHARGLEWETLKFR